MDSEFVSGRASGPVANGSLTIRCNDVACSTSGEVASFSSWIGGIDTRTGYLGETPYYPLV